MKRFALIFLLFSGNLEGAIIINEVGEGENSDWAEIRFDSDKREKIEISNLYVTMYYGKNEKLSDERITLYSYDRAETPYDDRYAVVHLTDPSPDECDRSGDSNGNGYIDIYCSNYSGSLWSDQCVLSIDSDDEHSNGMIDFIAYSNRNETSSTLESYISSAVASGKWDSAEPSAMIRIPDDGLRGKSISRRGKTDSNSSKDFAMAIPTPGRENRGDAAEKSQLFRLQSERILIHPGDERNGCVITLFEPSTVTLRVFSDTGIQVFKTDRELLPGENLVEWGISSKITSGLYPAVIECRSSRLRRSQSSKLLFIVNRYR